LFFSPQHLVSCTQTFTLYSELDDANAQIAAMEAAAALAAEREKAAAQKKRIAAFKAEQVRLLDMQSILSFCLYVFWHTNTHTNSHTCSHLRSS
jgi:hypothetical protein